VTLAVLRMAPISMRAIERIGVSILETLCPEALERPTRLDVQRLVEHELPRYEIHVYPVAQSELPNEEAVTYPQEATGEVVVAIREEIFNELLAGGRRAHRARATLMHELGHAVLHARILRERLDHPAAIQLLARVPSERIKPYCNSEWQAWALAGCVLMPRRTLEMLRSLSPVYVGQIYGVSEAFALAHLKRLKLV
jgi:hypothetical protein